MVRSSLFLRFNPRTHEECDIEGSSKIIHRERFNPRTHEECDALPGVMPMIMSGFNPRTHEECDLSPIIQLQTVSVSIHALTKSATKGCLGIIQAKRCFNPRTHEECDCIYFLSLISRYLEQCFRESS